jgi:membrane-associated phospholipid phosphatase
MGPPDNCRVTADVDTAATAPGAGHRLAKIITEVLSPAVIVVLLPFAVAWNATGHALLATVVWALVVAVFYSVLPMVFMVRGARRGKWDGHWVRERERRFVPLLMCLVSALVGLAILLLGDAPRDVIALAWSMITVLLACMLITRWWKVSIHATVAGGSVATVTLIYGWVMLVLVPLVVLVAWSRVVVRDHTFAQVVVGALLGPVVGGVVFVLLR